MYYCSVRTKSSVSTFYFNLFYLVEEDQSFWTKEVFEKASPFNWLHDIYKKRVPMSCLCPSALRTELNIGLAKQLLTMAKKALDSGQNFHIGSRCLWARHNATVCRLTNQVSAYQLKQVSTGRCQFFVGKLENIARCLLPTNERNCFWSLRMYLWWSLCTLYLHACQVRVTVGNSCLCCCACVTYFEC